MPDSILKTIAVAAALLCSVPTALSQEAVAPEEDRWIATCSQDSRLVYRERMTSAEASARQRDIVRRYPNATCVFIAEKGIANVAPIMLEDVAGMQPGTVIEDQSLSAALAAITGEQPLPVIAVQPSSPLETPSAHQPDLETVVSPPQYAPAPGWVRMSTYVTDDLEDVLLDWERIVDAFPPAARYVPSTMSTDDGYIMLSAGPMTPDQSWNLCIAAQSMEMDCEPMAQETPEMGLDYLGYMFPSAFPASVAQCDIAPTDSDARLTRNACWRSSFAAPKQMPEFRLARTSPPDSFPPLPRPRPLNGAASSEDLALVR